MSSNEKQPPINPAAQSGEQQQFPPPPPGPPPIQISPQAHPPKHFDETPLPDYDIPGYNPRQPHFAPPPANADDDIYEASPTDQHAPKWGHHHQHGSDGEGKKMSSRLSAFGEAFTSKVSGPVNAIAHKFGSEGFLPESLDKECEKAARILRGFCKDGIYSDAAPAASPTPETTNPSKLPPSPSSKPKKTRVLLTIPSKVIARAQGLAIFTAVRVGFQASGSSGSGILLARLPDGTWSPPSAIQITSIGAGFVAGVDIYDCVIVINTREALDLFTKTRLSLGSDLAVTAGPYGAGGALDWGVPAGGEKAPPLPPRKTQADTKPTGGPAGPTTTTPQPPLSADNTHFTTPPVPENQQGMGSGSEDDGKPNMRDNFKRQRSLKPVYSYVKSRGLFAGVQIDGTVIVVRDRDNAKFYGQPVSVEKIINGEVPAQAPGGMWPAAARGLFDVLKGAEGWKGQQQPGQQQPGQQQPGQQQQGQQQPGQQQPGQQQPGHQEPQLLPHQDQQPGGGGIPAFGALPGTGGAPTSAWVPPPHHPADGSGQGGPGVTTGMRKLGVEDFGPSNAAAAAPTASPAASAKAAEAAAEAAHADTVPPPPPPPTYLEMQGGEDLPPAYVEDERYQAYRPAGAGDSKTGQH
ncbi:hypothetical protein N658DRAFT_496583 [Parathielavia hyrcaniae]|uniref:Ysc84 actin-binding domain-containing protein n=1 Tax=Parathielavia hyrcaniae TaxID=113614 RepID=A0AAN6Q0K0_9PEZI|nr:hypothetical protein N658DRAFT_496583 [Parathielavia hyrcaniae]